MGLLPNSNVTVKASLDTYVAYKTNLRDVSTSHNTNGKENLYLCFSGIRPGVERSVSEISFGILNGGFRSLFVSQKHVLLSDNQEHMSCWGLMN